MVWKNMLIAFTAAWNHLVEVGFQVGPSAKQKAGEDVRA